RTRALNATPNALSLSRMRYFGALSQGNASVICHANHSAVGLRVAETTTTTAGDGREQEMRVVVERQLSEPQTDQSTQSPPYDCEGRSSRSATVDPPAAPCRSKPWTGRPR